LFPMLTDEEIDQLAEDIKANGQLHPIIVDGDTLIDGRNRLEACRRAGVEPTYEQLGDRDPVTLILSVNINRRHLTVGQRAIALTKAFHTDFSKINLRQIAKRYGIAQSMLSYAIAVIESDPELVRQVELGASLPEAYRIVQDRKRKYEEQEKRDKNRLAELEKERKRLLASIEGARAEIGESIQIPPEPDMEIRLGETAQTAKMKEVREEEESKSLKVQEQLLRRMAAVKREIAALAGEPVIADQQHVMAVRSWASQVVASVYGVVEAHNNALEENGKIRRIR
jgi:hypothetical protein